VYTLSSRAYGRIVNTFANANPTVQYKSIYYIIISVLQMVCSQKKGSFT